MNLALLLLKRQLRKIVATVVTPEQILSVVNYFFDTLVWLTAKVPGEWDDVIVNQFVEYVDEAKRRQIADKLTEKLLDWVMPMLPMLTASSDSPTTLAQYGDADAAADLVCAEFCGAAKKSC